MIAVKRSSPAAEMGERDRRLSLPNEVSGRPTSLPNGVPARRVSFASGIPGGHGGSASSSRRGSKARSSLASQTEEEGMVFDKVCVDVKGKRILWDVSGRAPVGQLLAVMGPSGKVPLIPPFFPPSLSPSIPLSLHPPSFHPRPLLFLPPFVYPHPFLFP